MNKDTHEMLARADYLGGKFSHDEYYGQFLSDGLVSAVANRIGKDRILNSTDERFNDIPLIAWDNIAELVKCYCGRAIAKANGSGGLSLSELVCAGKRAAKEFKNREGKT